MQLSTNNWRYQFSYRPSLLSMQHACCFKCQTIFERNGPKPTDSFHSKIQEYTPCNRIGLCISIIAFKLNINSDDLILSKYFQANYFLRYVYQKHEHQIQSVQTKKTIFHLFPATECNNSKSHERDKSVARNDRNQSFNCNESFYLEKMEYLSFR